MRSIRMLLITVPSPVLSRSVAEQSCTVIGRGAASDGVVLQGQCRARDNSLRCTIEIILLNKLFFIPYTCSGTCQGSKQIKSGIYIYIVNFVLAAVSLICMPWCLTNYSHLNEQIYNKKVLAHAWLITYIFLYKSLCIMISWLKDRK